MRRIDTPARGTGRRLFQASLDWRAASVLAAVTGLLVSCKPKETRDLLGPGQALAAVLAEETVQAAGANKKIAIITYDDKWGPPSSVELAFKAAVERQGYSAFTAKSAYLGNTLGRVEVGLEPDDFFEAVQKAADSGAIVSFAGAPLLEANDAARLPPNHPPILIVATATLGERRGVPSKPEQLAGLLDAKIIQAAIINRGSDSTAPPPGKSDATHELFERYYAILRQQH